MIYSLKGKISMIDENTLVVNTGAVSYEVCCSAYTVYALCGKEEEQTILTYLHVREDAMVLYGFKDRKEKMMFEHLLLVSGIGPKLAVAVLSGLPIDELIRAIVNSDLKTLSSIKGVGKKTTERIVLELNSKLGGESSLENLISNDKQTSVALRKEIDEAVEVLVSTGLSKNEATNVAKQNFKEGMTSEQLVIACFKNLR